MRPASPALIADMDYGDVRGVQLENDPVTGLRTLSWYVEIADHRCWERQILVLRPDESHPIIEMWKMALEKHGDRSQDAGSEYEAMTQRVIQRQPKESRAPH